MSMIEHYHKCTTNLRNAVGRWAGGGWYFLLHDRAISEIEFCPYCGGNLEELFIAGD